MKIIALCNTGEVVRYVLLADHEAAVAVLTQERDALKLRVEALERPVSDEEWIKRSVMSSGLRVAGKDSVNDLIAARTAKKPSKPRLDPQGVDADWQDTGEPR